MNKHQFRTYCERILVPQIDAIIQERFRDISEVLDIIARELVRQDKEYGRALRRRGRLRKS